MNELHSKYSFIFFIDLISIKIASLIGLLPINVVNKDRQYNMIKKAGKMALKDVLLSFKYSFIFFIDLMSIKIAISIGLLLINVVNQDRQYNMMKMAVKIAHKSFSFSFAHLKITKSSLFCFMKLKYKT